MIFLSIIKIGKKIKINKIRKVGKNSFFGNGVFTEKGNLLWQKIVKMQEVMRGYA